jgi:RimJ/RimL family protein N-acetyltransferase
MTVRHLEPVDLRTTRLHLRPFAPADVGALALLAGEREIAANTLSIPHPYGTADAELWIGSHGHKLARGEALTFAITVASTGDLVGAIDLRLDQENSAAEMGYWIGRPYWNRGYATEAARAVVAYGFETLGLRRIYATHFTRNPASGEVMRKAGMRLEGVLRQHVVKWGVAEDIAVYGILNGELP